VAVRAVALDADGLPELVDLPEPEGSGLLVHVRACGLCGSDVEKLGRFPEGTVLGHELAGELESGERVTVVSHVPCGTCERCRAGHQSTCGEFRANRVRPGGFAERVRATHCVPVPAELGELATVYVEPLACVLRAAERVPRGRVLVVGCGSMGLLFVQALLARGDEVAAEDPRPDRLEAALALGAVADEDPVDAAVLCAHGGVNEALARLAPGGTLLVFAAPFEPVATDLAAIYRKELAVVGSRSPTPAYFKDAVRLLPSLALPEATWLPLERFAEGLELYRSGAALKVVFTP
jgi:L-iditol 2-dehydrogenase